VQMSFVNSP